MVHVCRSRQSSLNCWFEEPRRQMARRLDVNVKSYMAGSHLLRCLLPIRRKIHQVQRHSAVEYRLGLAIVPLCRGTGAPL